MKNFLSTSIMMMALLAAPALAALPGNLDSYGCRMESSTGYHCYTGANAGRIFHTQSEMMDTAPAVSPPGYMNNNRSINNNANSGASSTTPAAPTMNKDNNGPNNGSRNSTSSY